MYSTMSAHELKDAYRDVFNTLKITTEESAYLEESTQLQAQSTVWHQHRLGRITSSVFMSVCKALVINPPKHLVKTILMGSQFNSSKVPSLQWGISHEDEA